MDPILQQQQQSPAHENSTEDYIIDATNGAQVNGVINNNNIVDKSAIEDVPESPKSYDDLFPSLPTSRQPVASAGKTPIGEWNTKPKLASTTITQVLYIPVEERKDSGVASGGFGTDNSSKLLKSAMDRTNAKIEMSSSKDQSLTFLIRGKQDAVAKAKRELLNHFQTQAVHTLKIPKAHHRFILGKGGLRLQEMETKTATKISLPKANEQSDDITISGTRDSIDKAIHEIRIISDEQSKQAYEVITIPKHFHPFISGPSGEMQKKLLGDFAPSVRINIPPMSVQKDDIHVAGEKEGVAIVCAKIRKMHDEMERKFSEVSVEVKKSQHKYIIGPKGNSINEILAETGVFVEIPSLDSTSETITLRGDQTKLGLALTKVYEKANSVVSYSVECPVWLHKYIKGKKWAGIQKLTSELTKVHIDFTESDEIKVEGPPEEADRAREILSNQAKDLIENTTFAEINVDGKYHKHIIGKGGSTVNKIKQETDVMINIPDSETGVTKIRIEGSKDGVAMAKKELEQLVSKMENEREKDLIIESRFHRQLIGPKGESIQNLREEFPSVQISFPDVGSKSEIVKLRGPKDDVEKCTRVMNRKIKDLMENNYQAKVHIFKEFHKYIIGKGGVTIRKLRQEFDTKIDLPESGSDSDVITITGKKQNVDKTQDKIQKIQEEMANVVSEEIKIPQKIHNTMIGSGGKLIQSVMDDCGGVNIKFPRPEDKSDKVIIRGPKDDVAKAKKILSEMANEKQLSSITTEVRAKPEHHKFLIGRNGANVQKIRDETGARIIFPGEQDKDRETITILGTSDAVAQAKKELEARIKGLDNVIEEIMTVDPKHHRHFVARRGEVLRKIGDEFGGVTVSFPRSGVVSDKVTLKGAKNCVEAAKARISEIVNDLDNQITLECIIEQCHHRTVMGARGIQVQKLCQDFDVQIKIPERNTEDPEEANKIRIIGQKEDCEAVSKALHALVPINIEVNVPFEFHRYIIGSKGVGVRMLMDTHNVNIKVPSSEQQSNIVVITGPPANVEEAKAALEERCAELEKDKAEKEAKSFEVTLEVDPELHPKIIGRRGAVIQQLRRDFDVNIQLPKKGAPDDHIITITGFEEDAFKAKDAIMKIVDDFESMFKTSVEIDHRIHPMIIGRKGIGIRKIMQQFQVEIKLPRDGDENKDLVMVMGQEDNCYDCIDHLKNLEEDFGQEVRDREMIDQYMKPPVRQEEEKKNSANGEGFQVKGAPWQGASDEAFPTLGGGSDSCSSAVPSTPAWGPSRR